MSQKTMKLINYLKFGLIGAFSCFCMFVKCSCNQGDVKAELSDSLKMVNIHYFRYLWINRTLGPDSENVKLWLNESHNVIQLYD